MRISDDDVEEFKTLSQTSDFFEQLVDSIVPHILGYETEKLAVGLQLFGGVRKVLPDETVIPGTIHLALISDPGTFVDEISEYATRLAPKSVQVNGTDTTQVGLTSAAYVSSSGAKNWELDAGALALANNGLAAITQADQLDNDALAALKSVMRQQEIKASKGTATQTIPAQTSVLVSARPKYGRFDQYESIGTQIDLTPDLISQFDLIFTVSDLPEAEADQKEAEHILKTHHAGEAYTHREQTGKPAVDEEEVDSLTSEVAPEIDPEFLRKYIAYARRYCHPTLTEGSKSVIEDFYVDLRLAAEDQDSPVPVSARKIAAIVRLAEASARARLSDTIEEEDAQRAVNIIEYSLKQIGLNPDDEDFDADAVEKGTSKAQRDRTQKIRRIIEDLESEYDHGAPIEEIIDRAEEEGISEGKAEHEIDNLKFDGEVYEPRTDYLRTT